MVIKNVWYVVEKLAWNPNNDTIDYCDNPANQVGYNHHTDR